MHVALTSEMDENGRSHLDLDLNSKRLRLATSAQRPRGARHPSSQPTGKSTLLPQTPFRLQSLRRFDYAVNFHAQQLDAGKLTLHTVLGKMTIDHGEIKVPNLSGELAPLTQTSTDSTTRTLAAPTPAAAAPTSTAQTSTAPTSAARGQPASQGHAAAKPPAKSPSASSSTQNPTSRRPASTCT